MSDYDSTTRSPVTPAAASTRPGFSSALLRAGVLARAGLFTLLLFLAPPAPRAHADPDDERWSSMFVRPGITGTVECAVEFGGHLVVGGTITHAGSEAVHNVARWDGTAWHPLGTGFNGPVVALAVYNGELYAGGIFSGPGEGAPAALLRLARWTGTAWVAVGGGITDGDGVFALAVHGGQLIVGGSFAAVSAPQIPVNNVAGWNGSAWDPLAGGLDKVVQTLTTFQTHLVAGGYFQDRLARYDGVDWQRLGNGFDAAGGVEALAVFNGKLYVGGSFEAVEGGSQPAANLAAYDGSVWTVPGGGIGVGNVDVVHALVVSGTRLFIGGNFLAPGASLLRWDGTALTPLGAGVAGEVRAFALAGTSLYLGGQFTEGTTGSRNVVRWNGATSTYAPTNYGMALDAPASHLAAWNNRLVIGGPFQLAGWMTANGIATCDGYNYASCASGLVGPPLEEPYVHGSGQLGADLVLGGVFASAGGVGAANVARWNGTAWSALGVGFDGRVSDLETYGGQLVAAGGFTQALDRNLPVGHIARWDGTFWQPLDVGVSGGNEIINALAVYDGGLIAAGSFTQAGGASANRIARWDGTGWSPLGTGLNGAVTALAVFAGELYAGGFFTTAGGQPVRYLARWNGTDWSAAGTPPDNPVLALASSPSRLYAGGYFQFIGGQPAANVAEWDGTAWQRLGSGTDGEVQSLALYKEGLYAGGLFQSAGGRPSLHLARWELGSTGVAEPGPALETLLSLGAPSPNPFEGATRIRFTLPDAGALSAYVFDAQGRLVRRLLAEYAAVAGEQIVEWDGSDDTGARRGAGVYFIRIVTPLGAVGRKVLLSP